MAAKFILYVEWIYDLIIQQNHRSWVHFALETAQQLCFHGSILLFHWSFSLTLHSLFFQLSSAITFLIVESFTLKYLESWNSLERYKREIFFGGWRVSVFRLFGIMLICSTLLCSSFLYYSCSLTFSGVFSPWMDLPSWFSNHPYVYSMAFSK